MMQPKLGLRARHALRRPALAPRPVWQSASWRAAPRAWESTNTSTSSSTGSGTGSGTDRTGTSGTGDDTGHIQTAPDESILWFDNLFPLRLSGLLRFPGVTSGRTFADAAVASSDPMGLVKRAVPQDGAPFRVTEVLPRIKDGGAFVKFEHPTNISPRDIEKRVSRHLDEQPVKPFYNPFRRVKAGLVQGVPWLEDLARYPKSRLRVEFVPPNPGEEAVELSQETLYGLFRRYGKIADIISQPWDSKVLPKYAFVDFEFVRDAIMARNCLHGFIVPKELGGGQSGTKFRMSYEQRVKPHRFWEWIQNHPRIVIPVIVALLTGLTVVIFDPIRSFFVKAHISRKYRLNNSRLYRWLRRQTSDIFAFSRGKSEKAGLKAVWTHRKDLIDQLQQWLMETAETFIVIQGPRGSGKKEFVLDQALKGRNNVLVIDCKPIVEARGEQATIKQLASEVGYRPIFSWANSLSSMADLAVQSTTGVKAGFSDTFESQLQKILQTTAGALQDLDASKRHKSDSDASLPIDAYLEAHPEKRAVVVIDNFLHKSEGNAIVYDKIAEWAAALVQSHVAHVVFLTTDATYSKSLSKSLPDRVFRQAALGDLSPSVARKFILSHLNSSAEQEELEAPEEDDADDVRREKQPKQKPRPDLTELDSCIGTLGGRMTDLEFFARRLKAGQTPRRALSEIVEQSASEILKMFLLPGSGEQRQWTSEQAWHVVKAMAAADDDSLRYNEVLLAGPFATEPDGEAALEALATTELVAVAKSPRGRPLRLAPGRPVYQAAFVRLARDRALAARLDLAVSTQLARAEALAIEKAERELAVLGSLPRQPAEAGPRVSFLLDKLASSQVKVEAFEKEMAAQKKILASED
ncbi:RNA12 protein-domain-containing protein [Xylariaceae sp. FL0804]|nr:RNA12 protein-domain-containing protein [Xylariaceae sp. FL0804]